MRVLRGSTSELKAAQDVILKPARRPRVSGRGRLVIVSGKVYELTLKVREGLPFIPLHTMNMLLESAMAQACYLTNMNICHYVWMANHAHILVVARDPESLAKFYGIIKKSMTDFIKRLLGRDQLRLWEGRKVHLIPTPEAVVDRIAYFYANPAKADLVDKIEHYPGSSSFRDFCVAQNGRIEVCDRNVPWIRPYYLNKLDSRRVSAAKDLEIAEDIGHRAYYENELRIRPNEWLKAFGLDASQAEIYNKMALKRLRIKENKARAHRASIEKPIIGAAGLTSQPIMKMYQPVKKGLSPMVICSDPEVRSYWIAKIQRVRRVCRELYEKKHRHGLWTDWPAGVFPSRSPVRACRLA